MSASSAILRLHTTQCSRHGPGAGRGRNHTSCAPCPHPGMAGSGRRWLRMAQQAVRGAARAGGAMPCHPVGSTCVPLTSACQLLPAWTAASARALSSSHGGGRQGERGKATGSATGSASGRQPRENPASIVFPDMMARERERARERAKARASESEREREREQGRQKVLESASSFAAEAEQLAGRATQTGARPLKPRRDRERNLWKGTALEGESIGRQGDSAVLAGPLRGIGGTHRLPSHLTKLWEWARERARVNSNVCVDWLGKEERKQARSTCEAPAGTESFRGELDASVQARPATAAAEAHSVHGAGRGVVKPTLHPSGMADVPASVNGQARFGVDHRRKLDREFWDTLLLQRDPTKGLREVALRSLMYESSAEAGEKNRPIDPTLWWMESLVRIKWGGGGYLPRNLRRGQERKPIKGEKVLINHVIQVVAQAPCRLRVRWAALLHDVGKPTTAEMQGGKLTFTAHERVGAAMVDEILSAYGYDEKFRKEVATLVLRSGRIRMVERFNDQGARRLMAVMGPLFDDLLDLYAADCTSGKAHRQAEHQARADLLTQHVQAVLDRDRLTSLRSPLNGHDIMRITGLKPGMHLGRLVRALREDYLRRGPYSASEAYEVVARMHEQLKRGEGNPVLKYNYCRYKQGRVKRSDMVGGPGAVLDKDGFPLWRPLQVDAVVDSEPVEREEVHVLRLRLDSERSRVAQGLGEAFYAESAEGVDVFRDIAVRRDTSLYTLAKVVTHAFDFDFDDDFAFYRRRRGLECPGAEAAYSGIPTAMRRGDPSERVCISPPVLSQESIQRQEHVASQHTGENRDFGARLPTPGAVHEELLLEQDFELLARTCGSSLRSDNHQGGIGFRYDALDGGHPGHLRPDVEWKPDYEGEDTVPVHASNGQLLTSLP